MTPQANKTAHMLFGLSECFRGLGYTSILVGSGAAIYALSQLAGPDALLWAIVWGCAGVVGSLPAFTVAYLVRLALQIEEHLRPARAAEAVPEQV